MLDDNPFNILEDNHTMDIYSKDGTKVVFTGRGGYGYQQSEAREHLTVGAIYTVEHTEVHSWSTDVYLYEVPGIRFNSVMFDKVKEGDSQ